MKIGSIFFPKKNPDITPVFVFQLMDQALNPVAFIKIVKSSATFNPTPSPEGSGHWIVAFKVEIGSGKMKIAVGTDHPFMCPETISATCTNIWEYQADKIIEKIHTSLSGNF